MKISREIIINGMSNNTEYELTGVELERCYNEYVEVHDKNEVTRQLKDLEYEDLDNIPEEIIADLASQVREKMEAVRDEIVLDVIHKNEEVLAPYKRVLKVFEYELTRTTTKTITVAAYSEEDADAFMENTFGNDDDKFDEELEGEYSDYDYGTATETDRSPNWADYNAEEDDD